MVRILTHHLMLIYHLRKDEFRTQACEQWLITRPRQNPPKNQPARQIPDLLK